MHHLRRGQWRNSSQDLCDLTFHIVRVEGLGWRIWRFFRCTIAGKWGGAYETKTAELCKCVSESDLDWPGSQVVSPVTSFGNIGNNSKRHKIRRKRWWRLQMRRAKNVFDDADDDWTVTKHRYNIYIYTYVYMYVYLYVYIYAFFTHIYTYIFMYIYIYIYIHMCVCMYTTLLREQVAAVTILRYFARLEQETRYRFYDRNKIKLIIFWMVRNDRGVGFKLYHVCCTYCLLGN